MRIQRVIVQAKVGLSLRLQPVPFATLKSTCGMEFNMLAVSDWLTSYLGRLRQVRGHADITGRLADTVLEGFDVAIRVGALA